MKRIKLLVIAWVAFPFALTAQQKPAQRNSVASHFQFSKKKYPSLLWEITGNGLTRPSYLFGTMHISDKLAFHLGDSFYNAIKSVQVVALETNPENWQDDFSKSLFFGNRRNIYGSYFYANSNRYPSGNMRLTSFAVNTDDEAIKASLAVEPSMINGLLYRTYGTNLDDFEEDTYLDMYIFQTGKKLKKSVTGVENFEESEKLVMEAYRDMYRDRNKKRKSFDYEGIFANPKKLEDAYRKGDLDLLDSLSTLSITSDAFEEKFLYRRNDIQANSIDTILKKSSLFVAVGAAHLPGKRGVIELLRKKGYILRPVKMDDRNSVYKQMIEKIRANTVFIPQTSEDGFYQVSIPGKKFYEFTDLTGMDVKQYADMVNGSYYVVTRIKTNSLFAGNPVDLVHRKIDSLLYENIPGKILKKLAITRNGYKGWEILNRTRRGDNQRYNIFITPFEVIVFKMSGNGDYIIKGPEAQQFFGSIRLKEYNENSWTRYQPPTGGFSVQLPHAPSVLKDNDFGSDRLEYAAYDKADGNSYLVMTSNIHNYSFVEEDTFELNLMSESYGFSSFIDKQVSHKFTTTNGYPSLECKYQHKDGSYSRARYIIRGPIYYVVSVRYKNENKNTKNFFDSFSITPFVYPEIKFRTDTNMHFTVQSPAFDDKDKEQEEMKKLIALFRQDEDDENEDTYSSYDLFGQKTRFIGSDTIGEKILVTYDGPGSYSFLNDTANFWKKVLPNESDGNDSTFIFKRDKTYELPGGIKCRDLEITDTGSSRIILSKWLYEAGHVFTLTTLTDTISTRSPFLDKFFKSFAPGDSLEDGSVFTRKTGKFFSDFFSTDSATARTARKALYEIEFDSLDAPLLENAIQRINWNTKNYPVVKKHFISELGNMKSASVTDYLKNLYFKVRDSAEFQNTILDALLEQETQPSFIAFKDLILAEPPISRNDRADFDYSAVISRLARGSFRIPRISQDFTSSSGGWSQLYDTLALARVIFPDFLQLMNVDDYKDDVVGLLSKMVDSGFVNAIDYQSYFSKFYLDAKQLLKKQIAKEEESNIEKLANKNNPLYEDDEDEEEDNSNQELENYSILLIPFYDKNEGVKTFFDQLLASKSKRLRYSTFILMLRNEKPLNDSLYMYFAKQDGYRYKLYKDLKQEKKLDKFPDAYKNQKDVARSMMLNYEYGYTKPDSIAFIDKLPVTYKNKKGWVYFFKYKQQRDDDYWKLAGIGMQPENLQEIDIDNDDLESKGDRRLETDKPLQEQLEQMLHEMLYSTRSSASSFYEARSFNMYRPYLSEMVKSRRYRD
jgi:uncharacterized protein YbaP (TraB family)